MLPCDPMNWVIVSHKSWRKTGFCLKEMAADMDRVYCEWPQHDEIKSQDDCQETLIPQLPDHGSISFGRFAVETLSWEKWSVFSHNRCKEELEKFKAPGLVAQKKAYFEEYYRKIRALKALQAQQEGPMLGSEGDGSVCSQTADDEHNTPRIQNCTSDGENHVPNYEENGTEISFEQERVHGSISQMQQVDTGSTVSYQGSPERSFNVEMTEEIKKMNEDVVLVSYRGSPRRSVDNEVGEEIKQEAYHDSNDGNISWHDGSSTSTVECKTSAEVLHPELVIIKESNCDPAGFDLNDKKSKDHISVPKKNSAVVPDRNNMKRELRTKVDALRSSQRLKYPLRKTTGKIENHTNMSKATSTNSISSIKQIAPSFSHKPLEKASSATSVKNNSLKVDHGTKPDAVKSLNRFKYPHESTSKIRKSVPSTRSTDIASKHNKPAFSFSAQRQSTEVRSSISVSHPSSLSTERRCHEATRKVREGVNSSTRSTDTVSRNNKSDPSVSKHGRHSEEQSRVTVPHPFSLKTEKRTRSRDAIHGSINSSASNISARLPIHSKTVSCSQNTSVRMAVTGDMKNTALAIRRHQSEIAKQPSFVDTSHTMSKLRDGQNSRHKAMSTHVPARAKSIPNGRLEVHPQSTGRGKEPAERNAKEEVREVRRSSKAATSASPDFPTSGHPKLDSKKMTAPSMDPTRRGRKLW